MAQTNFTPISLYYSATATNVPTAGNLVAGELALNTADGKLFYKDSAGIVQTLASKSTTSGTFPALTVYSTGVNGGVITFGNNLNASLASIGVPYNSANFTLNNIQGYPIIFQISGSEISRYDASGNFLLGTTSTVGKYNVVYSGTYGQYIQGPSGASTLEIFFSGATNVGSISTTGTVTSFNVSSDRRLKENIKSYTSGLQAISALTPREYNYISDKEITYQGFIADELQQVIPHAVTGETDAIDDKGNPIYQGVDASFLVPHLVSAIQEQQALIESLTTRLTALENK